MILVSLLFFDSLVQEPGVASKEEEPPAEVSQEDNKSDPVSCHAEADLKTEATGASSSDGK